MLLGNITDGSGISGTWSFVNATGKPGDIAFCRVLSNNTTLHCDNFAKSTTVAVTPTQIDSAPIAGGYTGGGQWVKNLLGDGMPGFCISTPPQTVRSQPVFSVGCMVSTGSAFAARLDALIGDSPKPCSQRWVDMLGDGTKAFCWESSDHPQVSCSTVDKDAQHFENVINSGQVQVGSYGQDETWWADVNGDGKADYCRAVIDDDNDNHITCTLMGQFGFGATFSTPPLKLGYAGTGSMVEHRRRRICRFLPTHQGIQSRRPHQTCPDVLLDQRPRKPPHLHRQQQPLQHRTQPRAD